MWLSDLQRLVVRWWSHFTWDFLRNSIKVKEIFLAQSKKLVWYKLLPSTCFSSYLLAVKEIYSSSWSAEVHVVLLQQQSVDLVVRGRWNLAEFKYKGGIVLTLRQWQNSHLFTPCSRSACSLTWTIWLMVTDVMKVFFQHLIWAKNELLVIPCGLS